MASSAPDRYYCPGHGVVGLGRTSSQGFGEETRYGKTLEDNADNPRRKLHLIALFHRDATITTLCGYQCQIGQRLEGKSAGLCMNCVETHRHMAEDLASLVEKD
jgi:hypothetical protein